MDLTEELDPSFISDGNHRAFEMLESDLGTLKLRSGPTLSFFQTLKMPIYIC
jgi:hypothetical protein